MGSRKKTKKTKNQKKKIKKDKREKNKCLLYFSMEGCPYCDDFKPLWEKTINKYPKLDMFNISREKETELMDKLSIKSYPTILLLKGNNLIKYNYERKPSFIRKFLVENKII